MSLNERLKEEMKLAMKGKKKLKLDTIRLIMAAIKNKEIELRKSLEDEDVIQVLSTMAKQRKESIALYKEAGRVDLQNKEESELEIIMSYLPSQLSRSEIEDIVKETIDAVNAQGMKDMGLVMKDIMPKVKGRADGGVVRGIVQEKLSSL
jgi:uncharacterized protein YqeY